MNKILISTLIYIPLMVILGIGVYEIPESWYLNLVVPKFSMSIIGNCDYNCMGFVIT